MLAVTMTAIPLPRLAFVTLAAACLAGCAATNAALIKSRIKEKSEVYAGLTRQQQKDVNWGYIRPGFTPDMVYIALGKPDQVIASADKNAFVWVFIDRKSINQDLALTNAILAASRGDNISSHAVPASNGTTQTSVAFSGSNANYPIRGATTSDIFQAPNQEHSDAYAIVDTSRQPPTTWVAFRDNSVVSVRHFDTHESSGKTGSLGG